MQTMELLTLNVWIGTSKNKMDSIQIAELVGIILIVCWVAKQVGLKSNLIPVLALVLGGVGAFYFSAGDWLTSLFGVFTGLATTLGYREVKGSTE